MKGLAAAIVSMLIVGSTLGATTGQAQDPARLFKAAMDLEMVDRDPKAAIEAYKKVVAAGDRALAAQALFRMAECYEKLGSEEAQRIYAQLTNTYADQKDVAAQAQARLAARPQSGTTPFAPLVIDPRVPRNSNPSPDGREVMDLVDGALIVVDVHTGARRVVVGPEPVEQAGPGWGIWSPDGRSIAFNWVWRDGARRRVELRTVTIKTGAVRTLANQPIVQAPMDFLAWTAGDEIVYRSRGQSVVFVPVAGGKTTEIELPASTPFNGGVDVFPDGSALLVAAGERLIRLDRATRQEQILTRGFPVSAPRISVDGRLVAYISSESGQSALRVAPLTAGPILRSVEIAKMPPGRNRAVRWTVDGRLTTDAGIATDNIYGMRLDDSVPNRRLVRLVHSSPFASVATISPDDRQIVYHGSGSLNVMNADGSGERPIGVTGVPVAWLSSDEVVVWTDDEGLRAVSLKTGTIRSIGFDGPLNAVAASVDMNSDSFQYLPGRSELMIRRLTSDRALFLSRRPGGEERLSFELPRVLSWRMSPQGDRIAYVTGGSSTQPFLLQFRSIGGDSSKVVGEIQRPGSERWTADGLQLVYRASSPKSPVEFRRYDVQTGETTVLLNNSNLEGVFSPDTSWSLGGCQLASNLTFVVCYSVETTVQRLGWTGVTFEAVMARLGVK